MAGTFTRQAAGQQPYSPALQAALARLDALVDWERAARARGAHRAMRVDSRPSAALLSALGDPHAAFRAVHVTGSKGKGSVAALVAAGLAAAGARVGVYGSPHVERVNERVRVAGAPLPDASMAAALAAVLDARDAHRIDGATWFDVVSAAGLLAFRDAAVDWAVVEVGLGGRKDSTNVLAAPVAVVTNIALEHADIIGPTEADIAHEKAGIFCSGCAPIVGMARSDPLAAIFEAEAAAVGARAPQYLPPLPGAPLAAHNTALARAALCAALPDADPVALLPDAAAVRVLAALPGRMEPFRVRLSALRAGGGGGGEVESGGDSDAVLDVTLDGAHVATSVQRVLGEVVSARSAAAPVVLLALGKEKDARGICDAVVKASPACVFVTRVAPDEPYLEVAELRKAATAAGAGDVRAFDSPDAALLAAAERAASENTHLVIIGSLHLAGRLRPSLREASVDPVSP